MAIVNYYIPNFTVFPYIGNFKRPATVPRFLSAQRNNVFVIASCQNV